MNTTIENYLYLITKKSLNEQEKTTFINKFSLNDDFFSKTIINQGENLSNGEKKKIQIIRLLLIKNDVDLFLLDEVLVSLDENTKHLYLSIVNDLKKEGKIVLMIEHGDNLEINFDNILDLN
jgi:subfamily B ATP-binding cassette protein MsbA